MYRLFMGDYISAKVKYKNESAIGNQLERDIYNVKVAGKTHYLCKGIWII
jgi:hypothetical protein